MNTVEGYECIGCIAVSHSFQRPALRENFPRQSNSIKIEVHVSIGIKILRHNLHYIIVFMVHGDVQFISENSNRIDFLFQ